jgi:hypothetical protein
LHLRDDDGIVVVEAGPGDASEGMDGRRGSPALHARLGQEGAAGLLELLETARQEWTAEVVGAVGERFERRLVQETSAVRVEMAQLGAGLRQEMAEMRADLLQGDASLRLEMREGFATIRQEMADQRFELLKWAFIFWVGQFFAVASLLAIAIRFIGPR